MSTFSERIKAKNQVMIAGLVSIETKAKLDQIAKATRRSKSGCIEIALRKWLGDEAKRIEGSLTEVVA